jgi:hypothetical protein|tara:strand:+ start:93 stop:494 length:402 start_codon:yes stop_codon:yes gene_type:complete
MKKILLLVTLCAITSIAFSQNVKECGTQDKLDEAIKKDPSILEKIKKNREQNQKWIELNRFNSKKQKASYPLIPGFTPTGDPKIDKINFQSAKAKLTNEDIEAYKKATRKENSKEYIEKRKQMIAKQNQEPKK